MRKQLPFWLVMAILAAVLLAASLIAISLKDTELRRNPNMEHRNEQNSLHRRRESIVKSQRFFNRPASRLSLSA